METGFLVRRRVVLQSVKTDNELSWSFAASDALSSCLEESEKGLKWRLRLSRAVDALPGLVSTTLHSKGLRYA